MGHMLDNTDRKILRALQKDASLSSAEVAKIAGISTSECSKKIETLENDGVIVGRVALLDPAKAGIGVTVFVAVTTPEHSKQWLDQFHDSVRKFPEVVEFYRMSGQVDYLLRVVVPDIEAYDTFYKKLIASVDLKDISSTFAMEQIKFTTALPLDLADDD